LTEKTPTLETTVWGCPAVPDVLQEHLEEIAYLSIQWRKLIFSPELPLRRLRAHTERIEAHRDGLRVGGAASVRIAQALLEGEDPWLGFAAAWTWIEQGQPETAALQQRMKSLPPEWRGAWKAAFRKLSASAVQQIYPLTDFETLPPPVLEIACDAWGWHQLLSQATLQKVAAWPIPEVRRAVARHAIHADLILRLLQDEDLLVRRMALWSLALQNSHAALERSRQMAATADPDPFGLRVLGLLGDRSDGTLLLPMLKHKTLGPVALLALRDLACPEFGEALLDLMEGDDEDSAVVAKDIFESLVGRPAAPLAPGTSPARQHWQQCRTKLSQRSLHGRAFPWAGAATEEPMEWVWRRSIIGSTPELAWLRREVPDGFFTGLGALEAIPGE